MNERPGKKTKPLFCVCSRLARAARRWSHVVVNVGEQAPLREQRGRRRTREGDERRRPRCQEWPEAEQRRRGSQHHD